MKKLVAFFFLILVAQIKAQTPSNDACENALILGSVPACPTTTYSNLNATATDIGANNNPFCPKDGNITNDVWFAFKTSSNIFDYQISVKGSSSPQILFPNVSIFRGECGLNNLGKLCVDTLFANSNEMTLATFGLTPNETYFIRVSSALAGQFKICITEYQLITIKNAITDACSGVIYDSGGPNADYKNGENFTYTICPADSHKCIKFSLEKYEIEATDTITFFNGATTAAPLLRQIAGEEFSSSFNAAAVAFDVFANANCLTIQFKSSSDTKTYSGFVGKWECSMEGCPSWKEIDFQTNVSKELIEKNIARPFSNTKLLNLNCGNNKNNYGIFNAALDESELGMAQGIILSSGDIFKLNNPAEINASTNLELVGDADLNKLSKEPSLDACVVEFEVYATTDEIKFDYIFGSEEYPDFISQVEFNDIFALMIEGQGVVPDVAIAPKKNLARLSNGTPISITEVNHSVNFDYYVNNFDGKNIAYNGFVKEKGGRNPLIARSKVVPCQTYKLKMAIADRGDAFFDSGVFVGNIRNAAPEIIFNSVQKLEYLVERCSGNQEQISFLFEFPLSQKIDFQVNVSGTATNGQDYNLTLPNILSVPAGTKELDFPISVINDAIFDDNETIIISLLGDYGCGFNTIASKTILIRENIEVKINARDSILICNLPSSEGVTLKATGATNYVWESSAFESPNSEKTNFKPNSSGWYKVKGFANGCEASDSIFATLLTPNLKIVALTPTEICEGKTISLKAENNFNNSNLKWAPDWMTFDNPNASTVIIKPNAEGIVYVSAAIGGCTVTDSVKINVNRIDMPALSKDTTICYKQPMLLAAVTFAPNTVFTWTPSGPSNPKINDVIIQPSNDIIYILKGQTPACIAYDTVKINVEGKLEITTKDTLRVCKGSKLSLQADIANISPQTVNFKWQSSIAVLDNPTSLSAEALPNRNGWIYATSTNNNCNLIDSIYIIVDSLPTPLSLNLFPNKIKYCYGDTILLYTSVSLPKPLYPNATFTWETPTFGSISPTDKVNLKVVVTQATTYVRTIKNGNCISRDSVKIDVEPSLPPILVDDVTICANSEAELIIKNANDYDKFTWNQDPALSCLNCPNPKAMKAGQFIVTAEKIGACNKVVKIVNVISSPTKLTIMAPKTVFCKGEVINVQLKVEGAAVVEWSPSNNLSCLDCLNPFVTAAGVYTVKRKDGCEEMASIEIVQSKLTLSAPKTVFCEGEVINVQLKVEGATAVEWSPSNNLSCLDCLNPFVTAAGVYTVKSKDSCNTEAAVTISRASSLLKLSSTTLFLCPNDTQSVKLSNLGQISNFKIEPFTILKDSTLLFYKSGKYQISGQSISNGCTENATIEVIDATEAQLSIKASPSYITYNDKAITLKVSGLGIDENTYEWDKLNKNNPIEVVMNNKTDSFTVKGLTTLGACVQKTGIRLYRIGVPSIFSPSIDTFKLVHLPNDARVKEVSIYDRWGHLVYESREKVEWNGKQNNDGEDLPTDVYIYRIRLSDKKENPIIITGDITLIR
jgi:gliding motility-associated-like protein